MSQIDGEWDCITKSPLGEQKSVFTIKTDGDTFTGSNAGPTGTLEVADGKIDGNTLTWKMDMKVPMPMTLTCTGTVDGDTLNAQVSAGAFGSFPMTGTRRG
ncbi:hypothetical protein GVO57_05415 [Sphingomonas changnyeongensis]|jgi:hypothetical protein|uniref:Uncharacterized protein n=1 Tax=Sphingomonas changnyeongensis TaxID=2698679 RepID=A0A7Z2NVM6_9SPHN|nr:hypothetical protein [Sphingomonas changnyeongensis]QHL90377.1 hypothetical protein GVO57_05415 [Sphingomonas changnyeongensis]